MRLSRHRQFSVSSEKSKYDHEQLNLFNETEVTADPEPTEPEPVKIKIHYRKAKHFAVDRLPSTLPVKVIEYPLSKIDQVYCQCGSGLHVIGCESQRELKIIPAQALWSTGAQNIATVIASRPTPKPHPKDGDVEPGYFGQLRFSGGCGAHCETEVC